MDSKTPHHGLALVDQMSAEGRHQFSFREAQEILGVSPTATANLLERLVILGLVDRVKRGAYVVRPLGVLGSRAAAENLPLVVGAAFVSRVHRIGYRTALQEHDLLVHPVRTVQVALAGRSRLKELSGRPFRWIHEPAAAIRVGAERREMSWISDLERSLLDAGARPDLVGGASIVAEAIQAARKANPEKILEYSAKLGWARAVRRLGSIADALGIKSLAGRLHLPTRPTFDLDLEPGLGQAPVWRDSKWRVRWAQTPDELRGSMEH